jgi:HEAT repeat protein
MTGADELRFVLSWCLATLAIVWAALSSLVLINRLGHEWRERQIKAVTDRLEASNLRGLSPFERAPRINGILRTLSRRAIYRLIARPSTTDSVAEACAAYTMDRWGSTTIIQDASRHERRTKWRRVAALLALAHCRDPRASDLLGRALESGDRDLAAAAVNGLTRLGDPAAAAILVGALRRKLYSPSRIATQLERFSIPIDDQLYPLLSDPDPQARYWATSILASTDDADRLAPRVAALTSDADASVRKVAIETLTRLGDASLVEAALRRLSDSAPYVRSAAIRGLVRAAELNPKREAEIVRAITHGLGDESWDVRQAAKEALVAIGPRVWKEVARELDSADSFARNGAAEVLQNICLLDELLDTLSRGDTPDREMLGVLGRAFEAGGPMMVDAALARSDATNTSRAAETLAGLGLRAAT